MSTVKLRGEGGSIFTFDLPLHPNDVKKLRRGELKPVDQKSARIVRELLDPEPEEVEEELPESLDEEPEPVAPAGVAAHMDMTANVDSIVVAVGGDSAVAEAVLEAELTADEPRKTLIEALGRILAESEEE